MLSLGLRRYASCLAIAAVVAANTGKECFNDQRPPSNASRCGCGELSALGAVMPVAQPNMTNFDDPAQCSDYVLISVRGTYEPQGISSSFNAMTLATLQQVANGTFYAVRYPATPDQNTAPGTQDLVESISKGITTCPQQNYALYGYSQGATVILEALPKFTKEMFARTKAVILTGSPYRVPGKLSNVDERGVHTPKANTIGVGPAWFNLTYELPDKWDRSGKVLDVCIWNDNICNSRACPNLECLATVSHLAYGNSQGIQKFGTKHVVDRIVTRP